MRLFTAILLSDDARADLDRRGEAIARCLRVELQKEFVAGIKWVEVHNLHVTLKFLGDVPDADVPDLIAQLRQRFRDGARHYLHLNGIRLLPPRGPVRVIAATVGGEIEALQETFAAIEGVGEDFQILRERRDYFPHITLARCRMPVPAYLRFELANHVSVGSFSKPGPLIELSSFALMQSTLKPEGPEYRTIATFPVL